MFEWFYDVFCKVEFLCYAGEPNWLGWIIILFFGVIIVIVASIACLMLLLLLVFLAKVLSGDKT